MNGEDERRIFENRSAAGKELAGELYKKQYNDPYILALPRGGVPVASEIASVLKSPINVIISRKIGAPGNPEFAVGAIAEGDVLILNKEAIQLHGFPEDKINEIAAKEIQEMERRISMYRNNESLPSLRNRTVVLVDDGVATGITALAAIKSIRNFGADKIIFAAPVCSYESSELLKEHVDDLVFLIKPKFMLAIGQYYQSFEQVTDEVVVELL